MEVFISWSGAISHKIACEWRDWLPSVLQSVKPYVSSEDIDKGARWNVDIAKELDDSSFGILCITSSNVTAPWLNFEAGALSKAVDKSRVCPFLLGIKRSDVTGPLLQFQSTIFDKDDVLKLVQSVNSALEDPDRLADDRLFRTFDVWWPHLEEKLRALEPDAEKNDSTYSDEQSHQRPTDELMEEALDLLRSQHRLLNDPSELLPPEYLDHVMRRRRSPSRRRREIDHLLEGIRHVAETINKVREETPESGHPRFVMIKQRLHLLEDEIHAISNKLSHYLLD